MKNFYEILGVSEDASETDIKKAYRRLATEWHPDKHHGKETLEEANVRFKEISEAYSILNDPKRRKEYDYTRSGGQSFGRGGFHTTGDPFSFFTHGGPFGFHQRHRAVRRFPGTSVQMMQEVSLEEAIFGGSCSVSYAVKSICEGCNGHGALEFATCSPCKGEGMVRQGDGTDNFLYMSTCHACMGMGKVPSKKCDHCKGQRFVTENKSVTVQIPAKVPHGSRLRLRGAGGRGSEGMPTGDLILEVAVTYPDLEKLTEEERAQLRSLLTKE